MEKTNEQLQGRDIIKVAIVGPESTGKTTLGNDLALHYQTQCVPEYAREHLEKVGGHYEEADLLAIAKKQLALEGEYHKSCKNILICDTNLLVIKVWAEHKYNSCHPFILNELKDYHYNLSILCDIDIPWEPDPLREHPNSRKYFFDLYKKELTTLGINHIVVSGNQKERLHSAISAINNL